MEIVRNIVEDAKSILFMKAYFVLVAIWHYECHQLIKEIKKGWGKYQT